MPASSRRLHIRACVSNHIPEGEERSWDDADRPGSDLAERRDSVREHLGAKVRAGRVKRTLQGRPATNLRLEWIADISPKNDVLSGFFDRHSARFANVSHRAGPSIRGQQQLRLSLWKAVSLVRGVFGAFREDATRPAIGSGLEQDHRLRTADVRPLRLHRTMSAARHLHPRATGRCTRGFPEWSDAKCRRGGRPRADIRAAGSREPDC